ncbi:MAG: PD-(D/E)XK nuclease family protein, partial [Clostridia bacterium]|nr:PD-(D/E)XK nuclease family protein [Clostridia bacterium]
KLSNEAFNPKYRIDKRTYTDKIVHLKLKSPDAEAEHVAESVAKGVRQGLRYRDFTVGVPSTTEYGRKLKYHFELLSIPYFIDEKINPSCHPLVRLIFAYFDVFRKNFERKSVTDFYKNPLFCEDKKLTDFMEVYCNKFNVNYDRFKKPFTLGEEDEVNKAENFRRELLTVLDKFNIFVLLDKLRVKEKVEEFTGKLSSVGETVTSQVNAQVYDAVIRILNDMQRILSAWQTEFTGSKALTEMKNVFKSGIEALELSVIPQYGDAVYVGDYRKTALARAKNLFALGLTSSVPAVKDDVAVLSDDDIKALENENLNIDPTVRIVNLRAKENFGVAMLAFSDKLYLSCPQVDGGGKKTVKSDFIAYVERLFDCRSGNGRSKNPNEPEPYLSKRQGAISFAKDCRAFANGRINDESMKQAHAYREIFGGDGTDKILEKAKSELSPKYKLDGIEVKLPDYSSPTKIEDFYDCPYKAFAARILRLKEKDDGSISAPIAGTFMHALFEKYFESFDKIKDKATSDNVFNEALNKTIENPDFKKFFEDKENGALIDRIISEAKKYCYKSYLSLIEPNDEENGSFVPIALEKKFSYKLPETGFKLVGTVDRIDVLKQNGKEVKKDNKPTVRIIDYKSGKADASDKLLYVGKKLQLYLYAAAFEADFVAGLYYATVKDEYLAEKDKSDFMAIGKTVNDENIIALTEKEKEGTLPFAKTKFRANSSNEGLVSADVLKSCVKYAVTMCENAVKQISDGVMIASPYSGACDYCKYKGLCGKAEKYVRKVSEKVKATQIAGIIDGDTNDGE